MTVDIPHLQVINVDRFQFVINGVVPLDVRLVLVRPQRGNDCKYNSVPDDLFDDDYSAYPYYRATAALARHGEIRWLALPFTVHYAWIKVRHSGGRRTDKPIITARPQWLEHGADVKSARTFRQNLEDVVTRARQNGQQVHLATFGWYIPEDYTEERFQAGELDYADPYLRIGVWGEADAVGSCIVLHNQILRDIARHDPEINLIDVEVGVPKLGRYYDDVCHFSEEGEERFMASLEAGLRSP